ncbi:MAG: hypothetical protein H6838_03065 [Planctomycetes bacterium]|nr:hypothetical protein [Planctomycetota bacterium]MCB9884442.1 hypothetical protein [Planctomycetota bacterium]
MTQRETDLERITSLLGQCLGRIDEQAYRLQQLGDDDEDFAAAETFEEAAATLQELIGSLLHAGERVDDAAADPIVRRALDEIIGELGVPVVVRQRLATELPKVACTPGQLAFAVQRALMLAVAQIDAGGEVTVETRRDGDNVLLEIESTCPAGVQHLSERALTLRAFVAEFGGACQVDTDGRGRILIALELPVALVSDS